MWSDCSGKWQIGMFLAVLSRRIIADSVAWLGEEETFTEGNIVMRRIVWLIVVLALSTSGAFAYSGSLSWLTPGVYDPVDEFWTFGGYSGTGIWIDKNLLPPDRQPSWTAPSMAWAVTLNPDSTWHYDYTFSAYHYNISHVIIETSANFLPQHLLNPTMNGVDWSSNITVAWQGLAPNPGMPETLYGIKFNSPVSTTAHITFNSPKGPKWGDFYAKDGKGGGNWNAIWNTGFTSSDTDPLIAAHNGSEQFHILVPDTMIPEPASLMSLAVGITGLIGLCVRKRR